MRKLVLALIAALIIAAPVAAAPAKTSLALVLFTPPDANYGETITFDVTTNRTDRPVVGVRCYQDGAFVYDSYVNLWPGAFGQETTLSSPVWTGGGASCTARLIDYDTGRQHVIKTLDFTVLP